MARSETRGWRLPSRVPLAGTRKRPDRDTAAVRKQNKSGIFPAPRSQDSTLDFNVGPTFLAANNSSFDADEIFNNAVRESECFHSAFSTGRVQGQTAVAVSTCREGGGLSDSPPPPPITPLSFTKARIPTARSARRIARYSLKPAVDFPAVPVSAELYAVQVSPALSTVQGSTERSDATPAAPAAPAAGFLGDNQVCFRPTPATFALARRSIMYSPAGSTAGARDCCSTPRTRHSRPASGTCSPQGRWRFPSTPEGEVDFNAPDTEDQELTTRDLIGQQ